MKVKIKKMLNSSIGRMKAEGSKHVVESIAYKCGVNTQTIYYWRKTGRIPLDQALILDSLLDGFNIKELIKQYRDLKGGDKD